MSPPIARWPTTSSEERSLKDTLTLAKDPSALRRIVATPEAVEPVEFEVGRSCETKRVGGMFWMVTVALFALPTV
jgi:hypothetical protein